MGSQMLWLAASADALTHRCGFRCPQGRAKAQEFGLFARDWVFRLEVFSSCRLMSLQRN